VRPGIVAAWSCIKANRGPNCVAGAGTPASSCIAHLPWCNKRGAVDLGQLLGGLTRPRHLRVHAAQQEGAGAQVEVLKAGGVFAIVCACLIG